MNRFDSRTDIVLHSRAGVVLAGLPVRRRRSAASTNVAVTLARLLSRLVVRAMNAARRPLRVENDDETQVARMRHGLSSDEGLFRVKPPRNLNDARYDLLRQVR